MTKKLLLLLLLLVLACNHVLTGRVSQKVVDPPYFWFLPVMCGKGCIIMIPMYSPEAYRIIVTGPNKKGELSNESIYLDKKYFDLIRIGDEYECGDQTPCITERPSQRKDTT